MEREKILSELNDIFNDTLQLEHSIIITEDMNSTDIEGWDSLSQIKIVQAVQKKYGIKIKITELIHWNNVGDIVDSIVSKI